METEVPQADPVDYDSLLPPRKRLLAGMKRQNCECSPPISDELVGHFHCLLNSSKLSPEDIVETVRSAALTAAEAAAAARATATEKAIAAKKAKAFARSVLELVASVSGDEYRRKIRRRRKTKKKHIPVELLYKTRHPMDEELARRLHRTMNSSTRISRKLKNMGEASRRTRENEGGIIYDENSTSLVEDHSESSRDSSEKLRGRIVTDFRDQHQGKVAEDWEILSSHRCMGNAFGHERRGTNKPKRLPQSQCCPRVSEDPGEVTQSKGNPLSGEPKYDTIKNMYLPAEKQSDEGELLSEATSVRRCNKFKISHCHSEDENLRNLCSIPAVKAASSLVKID